MEIDFGDTKAPSKSMKCPHCQVDLAMASRQNIEIDYCPKCRGVWLDRGELDKIIERSKPEAAPDRRERYDDRSEYKGKKYKKKKSWLHEIFDELT